MPPDQPGGPPGGSGQRLAKMEICSGRPGSASPTWAAFHHIQPQRAKPAQFGTDAVMPVTNSLLARADFTVAVHVEHSGR